jgi:hypothetical protein
VTCFFLKDLSSKELNFLLFSKVIAEIVKETHGKCKKGLFVLQKTKRKRSLRKQHALFVVVYVHYFFFHMFVCLFQDGIIKMHNVIRLKPVKIQETILYKMRIRYQTTSALCFILFFFLLHMPFSCIRFVLSNIFIKCII